MRETLAKNDSRWRRDAAHVFILTVLRPAAEPAIPLAGDRLPRQLGITAPAVQNRLRHGDGHKTFFVIV